MLVALNIEIEVRSYSNLLSRNASACGADLPATGTARENPSFKTQRTGSSILVKFGLGNLR